MNAPAQAMSSERWSELNQSWLTHELAKLRGRLDGDASVDPLSSPSIDADFEPALERCAALFGLSRFERDVLLLAAGVELDSALRESVSRAHAKGTHNSRLGQPTFSLAFSELRDSHWDALSPQAPLRRWKLIDLEGRRNPALQPIHIDERILHFITGVASFDERLQGIARLVRPRRGRESTVLGQRVARHLERLDDRSPLVVMIQERADHEAMMAAAEEALAATGSVGVWIRARDLPHDPSELFELALRADREASLSGGMPVVELDAHGDGSADLETRCITLLSHLLSPALLLDARDPSSLARLRSRRLMRLTVRGRDFAAQLASESLGRDQLSEALRPALQQFHLSPAVVDTILEEAACDTTGDESEAELECRLWRSCREAARGGLDALAQRVESTAGFDDLVLPATQVMLLREIAQHLRHRHTVYDDWGMSGKTVRGQGLCVLFAGESGTGKTLAAEAIANEAMLDLYRIDLATVVSKYIGETEKNLKRVFDAAEASGAVLLFDEADALYGKRSDVKDSHDRYANIEVAYLLQRVEAYRGLAILTTNFRSALDRAFLRRIRFIVQFPFPDEVAREKIWRRELPDTAPLDQVDFAALARMQLSGGHIRNVAVNAAFMAAGDGESISMRHLRHAAQREAAKLERPLLEASAGAWG
jgi:hypothetical protein